MNGTTGSKVRGRVEEAMREIGILFMALTPLDVMFADGPTDPRMAFCGFMSLGLALFFGSLALERMNSR